MAAWPSLQVIALCSSYHCGFAKLQMSLPAPLIIVWARVVYLISGLLSWIILPRMPNLSQPESLNYSLLHCGRNTLGNIAMPPEDLPSPLSSQARSRSNSSTTNMMHSTGVYGTATRPPLPTSTVSPQSLNTLRSWDMMSSVSDSPSACDDSFMSWEPPRRT